MSSQKPTALEQAKEIIYGDREKTYGSPDKNLKVIAEYWSTHLNAAKSIDIRLTVDDVCVMMMLLKQARLANSPKHEDSLVDLIGYAALKDRCDRLDVVSEVVIVPGSVTTCKAKNFANLNCTYPDCNCSTFP